MKRLFLLLLLFALPAAANAAETGKSGQLIIALAGGAPISAARFRPVCAPLRGAAVLFPGYRRNSRAYRDDGKSLARALCLLLYVPRFPAAAFPAADYQHGGKGLAAGTRLITEIQRRARSLNGGKPLPLILIGHSAGAQYLSRLAAYAPLKPAPARYILISAGTYAQGSARFAPPYGFRGLPPPSLSAYLRAPISVMIGGADVKDNAHLARGREAQLQGANRLTRAQNFFYGAQRQAARQKLKFGWDFTVIPNIGHSPRALLASPALSAAVQKALRESRRAEYYMRR